MNPVELREAPVGQGNRRRYELAPWRERYGLIAGITTRDQDFGLASPAPAGDVVDRWLRLPQEVGPGFASGVVGRQCHATAIAVHRHVEPGWHVFDATDGHVTSQPGVLLAITAADCVPVYLTQRGGGGPWFGLLHAGWRGVAGGMVERGISCLTEAAECQAGDIVIHCGRSICGACYEVGSEVLAAVTGRPVLGSAGLDLRVEIERRAAALGIGQVSLSPWCTAHDGSAFHSHRRSRGRDGRLAAYLGRPSA